MGKDKGASSDEYLKQYIKSEEHESNKKNIEEEEQSPQSNVSNRSTSLQFVPIPAMELPCGIFYPDGTQIKIRGAKVKEIQFYSMADDNNFYDVIEKMNDLLSHCVQIQYPNGKKGSYLDIKEGDRFYLLFAVRDLSFQKGNELTSTVKCKSCNEKNTIPLKRQYFEFHEISDDIKKYFDKHSKKFIFKSKTGETYEIGVPPIGLEEAYTKNYILKKIQEGDREDINQAFLKIDPMLISDRNNITEEGIIKRLGEFENISKDAFQFLNKVSKLMTFGIKGVFTKCTNCGAEVRESNFFRGKFTELFEVKSDFESYLS